MGVTVRQKKRGRGEPWHVFIHHDGIIKSKKVGDKKLAEEVASRIRKKLAMGEFGLDKDETPRFGEYSEHYLNSYARLITKKYTAFGYERIIKNHLLPEWKNKRLSEIRRIDIKRLLLKKTKRWS